MDLYTYLCIIPACCIVLYLLHDHVKWLRGTEILWGILWPITAVFLVYEFAAFLVNRIRFGKPKRKRTGV